MSTTLGCKTDILASKPGSRQLGSTLVTSPGEYERSNGKEMEKLINEVKDNTRATARANRDLRFLSESGYGSLAVCATFLAAMQAQVLSLIVGNGAVDFPLATALFFLGLLANVFGALLSYEAARWFEMLSENEVDFSEHCRAGEYITIAGPAEEPTISNQRELQTCDLVDLWITISITAGPYLVAIGMGAFILGLVLYICRTQGIVTKAVLVTFSAICTSLFLPFGLRHNRYWVLKHLHLERRSDVGPPFWNILKVKWHKGFGGRSTA